MNRVGLEIAVGLFLVVAVACFAYLAIKLAGTRVLPGPSYTLTARFSSTAGLNPGAPVMLAGVRVGSVTGIHLDKGRYESVVEMRLEKDLVLQDDSIASVRSTGIIGDKYVSLSAGGSEFLLEDGDEIIDTEPSVSLEELISKYIFEGQRSP